MILPHPLLAAFAIPQSWASGAVPAEPKKPNFTKRSTTCVHRVKFTDYCEVCAKRNARFGR